MRKDGETLRGLGLSPAELRILAQDEFKQVEIFPYTQHALRSPFRSGPLDGLSIGNLVEGNRLLTMARMIEEGKDVSDPDAVREEMFSVAIERWLEE